MGGLGRRIKTKKTLENWSSVNKKTYKKLLGELSRKYLQNIFNFCVPNVVHSCQILLIVTTLHTLFPGLQVAVNTGNDLQLESLESAVDIFRATVVEKWKMP